MKNLFKLVTVNEAMITTPLMASIMRRGAFRQADEFTVKGRDFPEAWKACLNVMQALGGHALAKPPVITSLESSKKSEVKGAMKDFASQIMVLHALPGVMMTSGDEAVQLASGDLFWYDNKVGMTIVNNSKDDLVFMSIDIAVDE